MTLNLLDGGGSAILDLQGDPITTTSDASGLATFDGLYPGTYAIEYAANPSTLASRWVVTST